MSHSRGCSVWHNVHTHCAGELPLLLAPAAGGRGRAREVEGLSEEAGQLWRHHGEPAGGGGEWGEGVCPAQAGHSAAALQLASPGPAPPHSHTVSGGPPQQGPEEQPWQAHHCHVQVCTMYVCNRLPI